YAPRGDERLNTRFTPPAVLLCAPFATIADGLAKFAGKPEAPGAGRSLFVYGFPPEDEPGVVRRRRERVAASGRTPLSRFRAPTGRGAPAGIRASSPSLRWRERTIRHE